MTENENKPINIKMEETMSTLLSLSCFYDGKKYKIEQGECLDCKVGLFCIENETFHKANRDIASMIVEMLMMLNPDSGVPQIRPEPNYDVQFTFEILDVTGTFNLIGEDKKYKVTCAFGKVLKMEEFA